MSKRRYYWGLNLWEHQKEAVKRFYGFHQANPKEAFLIKMPTGTGKTGIISVISHLDPKFRNVLITCPSTALRDQLAKEISGAFWGKIGFGKKLIKECVVLTPSKTKDLIKDDSEDFIIVSTIQAITHLRRTHANDFLRVKNKVSLVIFDEGHREPAEQWGKVIRELGKPTILLTATPYRNDLKPFVVDQDDFFYLSHQQCEKDQIIRKVEFYEVVSDPNPQSFVDELVQFYLKQFKELVEKGIEKPKVIIRCENKQSIETIVGELSNRGLSVCGIHDDFRNQGNFLKNVPTNFNERDIIFWVHQFKLVEGVDCADFSILAVYQNFGNSRSLIQQVGRVLRNPERNPDLRSYIFAYNDFDLKQEWDGYLEFDTEENQSKQLQNIHSIFNEYLDAQPQNFYFHNRFRKRIAFQTNNLYHALNYRLTANIYKSTLSLNEVRELIEKDWKSRDLEIRNTSLPKDNALVITYIIFENSPVLRTGFFLEFRLGYTVCISWNKTLFMYDSEGQLSTSLVEDVERLSSETFLRLLDNKQKYSRITLLNSDLGNYAIRSRDISSYSLEQSGPSLGDHNYFYSRIEADVKDKFHDNKEYNRRYIGLKNTRLRDTSTLECTFEDYYEWTKLISSELKRTTSGEGLRFLNRYAKFMLAPAKPVARNILLDLDPDVQMLFQLSGTLNSELVIENKCCEVINGDHFILEINEQEFPVKLLYDSRRKTFSLENQHLDTLARHSEQNLGLLKYLTTGQSFRIVLDPIGVYSMGKFLEPRINLRGSSGALDLLNIFHQNRIISSIDSEKGNDANLSIQNSQWHRNTLFGVISRQGLTYGNPDLENLLGFDYLVCDDMEREIADFIGIDTSTRRVVFIHAKCPRANLSASKLSDVCAQATKNLDYLNPFFENEPTLNIKKWDRKWKSNSVAGSIQNRIIKPDKGVRGKRFWNKFREMLVQPDVSREVWIMIGNGLNYDEFQKELQKSSPKPEIVQIIYLLRSTWSSIGGMGASFKIVC